MKLYYPESILPNPLYLPRTAQYCRVSLVVSHKEFSVEKNAGPAAGKVLEIEVPDENFEVISKFTTPENHDRMTQEYGDLVIRQFLEEMSDDDIYRVLDAAQIEYENIVTPTFGI